jgi:ornithine cyclodeaminase
MTAMAVRFISEAQVATLLTERAVRELMERTLRAAALGHGGGPLRGMVAVPNGWFAAMPAAIDLPGLRGLGAKLVSAFPGNGRLGKPTHLATIALFNHDDGNLVALVAGETITARRTAAVSVVATNALARRPRGRLAILGCGTQGRVHLEAFADAGSIESLALWSRTRANADALALHAEELGIEQVSVTETAARAASGADVVVTATGSPTPIVDAADLAPGAHVNAVGACIPDRRELPSGLIAESALYVDSLAGARAEAGDFILAAKELERELAVTELGSVLAGENRADRSSRFTVFESLGIGIEDVACAAYVLREAQPDSHD